MRFSPEIQVIVFDRRLTSVWTPSNYLCDLKMSLRVPSGLKRAAFRSRCPQQAMRSSVIWQRRTKSSTASGSKADGAVQSLLNNFNDPSSPFYMAPGEKGPAWPEPGGDEQQPSATTATASPALAWPHNMPDYAESREMARTYAQEHGFNLDSIVEWPVAWGETDQFRHINNVAFSRYFEVGEERDF